MLLSLQCETSYLTQTSSPKRTQAYGLKPNNGTHPCQEDSQELIITVATHTSCQAWLTVILQENHFETPLNPHPTYSAVQKKWWHKRLISVYNKNSTSLHLTQVLPNAHELGHSHHNPLTLTAMQQVNTTADCRCAMAQRDTGPYLNTTGLFWALSRGPGERLSCR